MRIGVDTGGTFTDAVGVDDTGPVAVVRVVKLRSDPADPASAVLAAVRASGVHIKDIATEDPDLEDVFLSLTRAHS